MADARRGYLFGVGAYLLWGLIPLYWKLLRPAGAMEIVAHRVIWSCLAVAVIVGLTRGWRRVAVLMRTPAKLAAIALGAAIIGLNWGAYTYGINSDRVVEASLGYFINPLVTVVLGVVVLRERLRTAQWVAVGVGAVAVAVLTMSYGHVPYIALALAATFSLYSLIKKQLAIPAADGLFVESLVLIGPALAFLWVASAHGQTEFGHVSATHSALMIGSGAIAIIPMLLFAGAANRIPLSAIGLLLYLSPVIQLICGVAVFGEPLPPVRLVGFALVWLALIVFAWDGVAAARARTRIAASSRELAPAHT